MWSKMSSDRFGGKAAPAVPGPGSYDLPPTLDDHGVIIRSSSERFLDIATDFSDDALRVHEDLAEPVNLRLPTPRTPRTPRRALQLQGKENSSAVNSSLGPRGEAEGLQKRCSMVDASKGDLAIAKKAAANAHAMLRSREAEIVELRQQVEELSAFGREWQRRANDLEVERRQKSHSAQHHETTIAGLQRSLEQSKSQVEAQKAQIEEMRRAGGRDGGAEEKRLEEASRELEAMARRLANREAAVKAAVAESDARLRERMDSMESHVAAGWDQVFNGIGGLQEQHDRMQALLLRDVSEMKQCEHRAKKRERALRAERGRLVGRCVVQQAYVGAALALWEREGQARGRAEERAALAQGSADHEAAELARARGAAEAQAEQLRAAARAARLEAETAAAERDALRERLEEAAGRGAEADRWQSRAEAAEAKSRACAVLVKERETLKRDVDALRAENDSLRATEKALQAEVERAMEQRAQLASHSNHRQKILISQSIKDENVALHAELKKARQQIFQLERRLEHLREAPDATTESTPLL